jgi:hypothetical protein
MATATDNSAVEPHQSDHNYAASRDGRVLRDASGERSSPRDAAADRHDSDNDNDRPRRGSASSTRGGESDSLRPRLVMRNGQQFCTRCLAYYCDHAQELDFEWSPEDDADIDAAVSPATSDTDDEDSDTAAPDDDHGNEPS